MRYERIYKARKYGGMTDEKTNKSNSNTFAKSKSKSKNENLFFFSPTWSQLAYHFGRSVTAASKLHDRSMFQRWQFTRILIGPRLRNVGKVITQPFPSLYPGQLWHICCISYPESGNNLTNQLSWTNPNGNAIHLRKVNRLGIVTYFKSFTSTRSSWSDIDRRERHTVGLWSNRVNILQLKLRI